MMNAEMWRRVDALFQGALELRGAAREQYLNRETAGDPKLRLELESLLRHAETDSEFLETSPLGSDIVRSMRSRTGEVVRDFEIRELLGRGGMGEVYRARDCRLDRDVALKFINRERAVDPVFLERFRREARAASALNHANICTVYDIGEEAGQPFLVMEFLRGNTLASRMAGRALPLTELLDFSIEIAGALAAAHERGILHRDIKSGNIFVVESGDTPRAKVLDFGLAKQAENPSAAGSDPLTLSGTLLGTVAYMSPEQVLGRELDHRSDLFSLGAVMYEMATGRVPFSGSTVGATFEAILHREPNAPAGADSSFPPELDRILRKALEKDRERRYANASALRMDLQRLRRELEPVTGAVQVGGSPAARHGIRRFGLGALAAAAAVATLSALGAAWFWRARNPHPSPIAEWQQLTNFTDAATEPALSPDGRMLTFIRGGGTFVTKGEIYVKLLPTGEPVALTDDGVAKMSPVFSPDASRIAYSTQFPWDTWVVPSLGGSPTKLLANASGMRWIDRERILFSEIKAGIHMGLVTAEETRAGQRDVYVPRHERGMAHRSSLSPDGKWVLVVEMSNSGWLPCRVVPFDGSGPGTQVGPPNGICTEAAWSPDGKKMYFTSDATGGFHIWRQGFPRGLPEQVTFGPNQEEGLALAPDGKSVITSVGEEQSEIWLHDSGAVAGQERDRRVSSEGFAANPLIVRGGKRIFYVLRQGQNYTRIGFMSGGLWMIDLEKNLNRRLLPGVTVSGFDISADGERLLYSVDKPGEKSEIWMASLEGSSAPRRLSAIGDQFPHFGRDGRVIFMAVQGHQNYLCSMREDGGGRLKLQERAILALLRVSPDGKRALVWGTLPRGGPSSSFQLASTEGAPPVNLCRWCDAGWSPDGRLLFVSPRGVSRETAVSIVMPYDEKLLASFVEDGFDSPDDWLRMPGARLLRHPTVTGVDRNSFVYMNVTAHRNLFRVPLPY